MYKIPVLSTIAIALATTSFMIVSEYELRKAEANLKATLAEGSKALNNLNLRSNLEQIDRKALDNAGETIDSYLTNPED